MKNLEESFQGKLSFVIRGINYNDTGSSLPEIAKSDVELSKVAANACLTVGCHAIFPHVNVECSTSQSLYGSMATVTIMPHGGQRRLIGSCVARMPYSQD